MFRLDLGYMLHKLSVLLEPLCQKGGEGKDTLKMKEFRIEGEYLMDTDRGGVLAHTVQARLHVVRAYGESPWLVI